MAGLIGGSSGGMSPETEEPLGRSEIKVRDGLEIKLDRQRAEIERLQDLYASAQKEIQRLQKIPDENESRSNFYEVLFWTAIILIVIDKLTLFLAR